MSTFAFLDQADHTVRSGRLRPGRTLRLIALYAHQSVLGVLAWRGFMLTLVFQQFVPPLLGLAIWSAALPGDPRIATYFIALLAVQLVTVCYEHETLIHALRNGSIATDLLLPHPVVLSLLGSNLAWRIWHVGVGAPVVVASALAARVAFDPVQVLLAVPATLLAAALYFLFMYCLVLTALWIEQARGVVTLGTTTVFLLGGAAAPITLFPERWRPVGEALPFRAMHGFPAEIAAGALTPLQVVAGYAWQLGWIALFSALAVVTWRAGIRRFTAVGG